MKRQDIYNCGETGITTLQKPDHTAAKKGAKQISTIISARRETLVTMCMAVDATAYAHKEEFPGTFDLKWTTRMLEGS